MPRIARDPDAFERFYREHVEAVQRFVARRVDEPQLAADLTADVFLAAIDSAHTYDPRKAAPVRWLFGIAHNVVAAERRRRARRLRTDNRIAGRALLDDGDVEAIEERIDAEAQARQLYRAMDQLSEGERAVLELVALDGLAIQDAARALGLRPGAARVRLHRARRNLKDQLASSSVTPNTTPAEVPS